MIASEGPRLGCVVDVLFDAARLGSEQIALRSEEVDLCDLIEDVVSVFSSRAEKAGVENVTGCQGDARTRTDGDRLAQVISNLVDNAGAHTPLGGRVKVGVSEAESAEKHGSPHSGSRFVLWVADTGPGIPPADIGRIFEPGFSSGPRGEGGPGLGLGLAISRAIVTALGGSIQARSSPGRGTTFVVYLP